MPPLISLRRIENSNLSQTPEGEIHFLQAAEALFSKGQSHRYRCDLFFESKSY